MAKPEDAAKQFLKGLGARKRQPWDEPIGEPAKVAPKKASPPSSSEPASDDIGDQVYKIAQRNRKFADRTKHLRKD